MNQTSALDVTDVESAINWWRQRSPSVDGIKACAQVLALAEVAIGSYDHPQQSPGEP